MRRYLPLLFLALPGCFTGTRVEYEPDTGAVTVQRSWLGGPFYCEFEAEFPDGTKVSGIVQSEVNLDAAVQRNMTSADVISKALDKVPNAGG